MARPLRIHVSGGWYHVTARGQNRQAIFLDDRDCREMLARLAEMTQRYGVEVHAYVLMPNHYHLLVRTPKGNLSAAMQWLNTGYASWWNRRHGRAGHVFQGRFKAVLVEQGQWLLELSLYVHFNPVAVKGLGWGKREKRAEASGVRRPTPDVIAARLLTLRAHRWSSYRAYAGYEAVPEWLTVEAVRSRVGGDAKRYRELAESRLRQDAPEPVWTHLRWGVVLGAEAFAAAVRKGVQVSRDIAGRRALRREVGWEDVVAAVERVKGEPWAAFRDRYGDWGRDLALWVARQRTGLTLRELGELAGGLDYSAVSEAIRYFERRRLQSAEVRAAVRQVSQFLNLEI